jgi:two-component system phosphate regulon sensor histidine kinase PhoR
MLATGFQSEPQEVLQKILDATREGVIVIVGSELRIAAANTAAHRAFCRNDDPIEGQQLTGLIENEAVVEAFRLALGGETSDIHLKHKLRGTRRYDVHVAPLELDGTPNAIGYFYDVTQVHRLENIRQEFLSNISHELRTPLTSILAFVETLEDGGLDDQETTVIF